MLRLHGEMEKLNYPPLTNEQAKALLYEILDQEQRTQFDETRDLDLAYELPNVARFRGNILDTYRGIAGVFGRRFEVKDSVCFETGSIGSGETNLLP